MSETCVEKAATHVRGIYHGRQQSALQTAGNSKRSAETEKKATAVAANYQNIFSVNLPTGRTHISTAPVATADVDTSMQQAQSKQT
jgi:hypothetical protein